MQHKSIIYPAIYSPIRAVVETATVVILEPAVVLQLAQKSQEVGEYSSSIFLCSCLGHHATHSRRSSVTRRGWLYRRYGTPYVLPASSSLSNKLQLRQAPPSERYQR
jgi:hypothetical protein